jgi:hypothetical protein
MAGSKRRRFVEKKKLGIQSWRHNGAMAAFKFQLANNPTFDLKRFANLLLRIVQAAAIAHQRSARRGRDNLAPRRDTILF